MPLLELSFSFPLNVSVQVGDITYYHSVTTVGVPNAAGQTYTHEEASTSMIEIGNIVKIHLWNGYISTIHVNTTLIPANYPTPSDFILFSKDNKVNLSSILGYYAEVEFRNNSWSPDQELFSVGCEFQESSK